MSPEAPIHTEKGFLLRSPQDRFLPCRSYTATARRRSYRLQWRARFVRHLPVDVSGNPFFNRCLCLQPSVRFLFFRRLHLPLGCLSECGFRTSPQRAIENAEGKPVLTDGKGRMKQCRELIDLQAVIIFSSSIEKEVGNG